MEHKRRHCLPLNFLRMPLGPATTSPFLYFCGVPVSERGPPPAEPPDAEAPGKGLGVVGCERGVTLPDVVQPPWASPPLAGAEQVLPRLCMLLRLLLLLLLLP